MKQLSKILISFVFLVLVSSSAWATYMADITYDYTALGNHYTFTYTVNNTSTDPLDIGPLDFFRIDFDADAFTAYDNVAWVADNAWWSSAVQDDPAFGGLPASILADASILGTNVGGIARGGQLGGFQVSFDYAGLLAATAQEFSFWSSFGTDVNGGTLSDVTGKTRYVNPVPVPASLLLLGSGLLGLIPRLRKRG